VGALRLDCAAAQADFVAVDAYKWMLTPNGAGFTVFGPELRERLAPQVIGWRSHRDWRNVDSLHHGAPEFVSSAEKYEGGMLPSCHLYALEAVVDLMLDLDPSEIERRVLGLAAEVRAVLRRLGAGLLSDEGPHYDSPIVAARFPDRDARALARALKDRRVLVSARHGHLRVSTHFYNNEADIETLGIALEQILRET
jgi:selenocysteine lyase/cysteine desulfurase